MLPIYALVVVVVAATPSPVSEMMTRQKTLIRESPNPTARVLGELPPNVKVQSDERKDLWFHISVKTEGADIKGWVHQADVMATMGRSKGQLIEENDRLYAELVMLREAKLLLEKDAQASREALRKAEDEIAGLKRQLSQTRAQLAEAAKTIERLEAALKQKDGTDD